jgi:two-component system response regulator
MHDPVLYVDDGPDDIFFMQRAFNKVAPDVELKVIKNGQDAADFFDPARADAAASAHLSLVILDLNLPGRSGLEVLAQIRKKSRLPTVPVVFFSASNHQADIDSCYRAGCNAYLIKPNDPERLRHLVSLVHDFWLSENRHPGPVMS